MCPARRPQHHINKPSIQLQNPSLSAYEEYFYTKNFRIRPNGQPTRPATRHSEQSHNSPDSTVRKGLYLHTGPATTARRFDRQLTKRRKKHAQTVGQSDKNHQLCSRLAQGIALPRPDGCLFHGPPQPHVNKTKKEAQYHTIRLFHVNLQQ